MLTAEQRIELAALEQLQDHVEPIDAFVRRVAPQFWPIPPHQREVYDLFERSRHEEVYATITEPPRHGKSTAVDVGLAYRTVYDPACLNFYASFGNNLTMAQSRKIRKLVRLAGVPLSDEVQNVNEWETTLGGGLKATSVGGDVTGRGCNGGVIVADDLIKGRKAAESKLVRDNAWDWLRDDLMSRLEPGASLFVPGTRWHEDDVIGRLYQDALGLPWTHINFPAIRGLDGNAADEREDPDARALWPEGGWDMARLRRIRLRGEHGWWSLYQQKPNPRGGGMFKVAKFGFCDAMPRCDRTIRCWDLAASTEAGSAYTAGPLVGKLNGKYYVGDVQRGQWSATDRDAKILETARADGHGVEVWLPQDPGQAGKSQVPHFAALLDGFVVKFHREGAIGNKIMRADPYASQVGAENVILVRSTRWNRPFIDEHEVFPVGKTKDQVDAMSGAYAAHIETPPTPRVYSGELVQRS